MLHLSGHRVTRALTGWPRDDRVAASAKMTRETVASVRAVCDLSPIAPAPYKAQSHGARRLALPAARFRPDAPASLRFGRDSIIPQPASARIGLRIKSGRTRLAPSRCANQSNDCHGSEVAGNPTPSAAGAAGRTASGWSAEVRGPLPRMRTARGSSGLSGARMNRARKERRSSRGVEAEDCP
jgi:hypothetical protein